MKFDNFVKYAGTSGIIMKDSKGVNWLHYDSVIAKVQNGKSVFGHIVNMPYYLEQFIYEGDPVYAELSRAYVPDKSSKPSELLREFENVSGSIEISIPNKIFGFIEKHDSICIDECEVEIEGKKRVATVLLVSPPVVDIEDAQFCMMVYKIA